MEKYSLAFEGGGIKGVAAVGALKALEEKGIKYDRLIGTSAGAITVALLAAGYSPDELVDVLTEKEAFLSFLDVPEAVNYNSDDLEHTLTEYIINRVTFGPKWVKKIISVLLFKLLLRCKDYRVIFNVVQQGGLYKGNKFVEWMDEKLFLKTKRSITFKEMYKMTGIDVSVVAADTDEPHFKEQLVLNHRTSPDLPVCWGVRMSMSIPFVFEPVRWEPYWGTYCGRDKAGHEIVDGGCMSNFPLDIFLHAESHPLINGTDWIPEKVLGFVLDESVTIPGFVEEDNKGDTFLSKSKLLKRISKILDTCLSSDTMVIFTNEDKVIKIPVKGCSTMEFDLPEYKKNLLVASGYESTKRFLA